MDTSNLKETLKAIDAAIAKSNAAIERGTKLGKLMKNPDFIDVILNGYFDEEARRLFKILTDPTGASTYTTEEIQLKLGSISDFKSYVGTADFVGTITIEAERALGEIQMNEELRREITADYADGE